MISKVFFLLTFLSSVVFCTEVCLNKSPCKCILSTNEVIDLSSVGLLGFPRFFEIKGKHENDIHLYSYNPCHPFTSPGHRHTIQKMGNKPCVDAAACIRSPGGNDGSLPEEYAIGLPPEGTFGTIKETDTIYHINYTVPGVERTLMVKLNCTNDTDNHVLSVETMETETSNLTIMMLNSKCACPNLCGANLPDPPNDGMSTGSKLLIAFFTILLAYFIIGIGWNFCNGAQGLELVPNYEFWNDLPKLIIEGVAFTCSCCGGRAAYGEV